VDKSRGHWLWTGATTNGYGSFRTVTGKGGYTELASRFAYRTFVGELPEDMDVCHTCDTPACVTPSCLFLGTPADNKADSVKKLRHAFGERQGNSRLTVRIVQSIRKRVAAGERQSAVAKSLWIFPSSVWKIVARQQWKHCA
jgi:hypothetical protein